MNGKLGPTKRFGTRYGSTLKHKLAKIERLQRAKHKCPQCSKLRVKRVSYGIWQCTACGHKFASRSYSPAAPRAVIETKKVDIIEVTEEIVEAQPEQAAEEENSQ